MRNAGYGILALLMAGCTHLPDNRPAWMANPQELYPRNEYLSAVGEGDTRRAAENNASAGLARIFESSINATETLSETAKETAQTLDRTSLLKSSIQVGSNQNLLNIQFGETFTSRDGRVYVTAFIPRAETAAIYRQRIEANSNAIVMLSQKSTQSTDPLSAYAFRRAAVRKALENNQLIAQLDIIDPGARDRLMTGYDLQSLLSEAAASAQYITFHADVAGDAGAALREALTSMGFSEGSPAILTFSGGASIENTDLHRDPLVFVRCTYRIDAHDADGNLILSISEACREGHINYDLATNRARINLRAQILRQIPQKLGETLDRMVSAE